MPPGESTRPALCERCLLCWQMERRRFEQSERRRFCCLAKVLGRCRAARAVFTCSRERALAAWSRNGPVLAENICSRMSRLLADVRRLTMAGPVRRLLLRSLPEPSIMTTRPLALIGVSLCLLFSFHADLQGRSEVRLTAKHFVGAWLGYSDDSLSFIRLELDPDGKGFLCITYLPTIPTTAYRVSWQINGVEGFTINVTPLDAKAEPITLKMLSGAATNQWSFVIRGKEWSRNLLLFREASFEVDSAKTAERMRKLRTERQ